MLRAVNGINPEALTTRLEVIVDMLTEHRRESVEGENHVEAAGQLLSSVHDWQAEEGITDSTMLVSVQEAQVRATLELAKQQRIANLIAYASHRLDHTDATGMTTGLPPNLLRMFSKVDSTIREWLGVHDGKDGIL
jgi:hypothetical protein